jgi:SAM-dependent methyltransferase
MSGATRDDLETKLGDVAERYPDERLRESARADVERQVFHISTVMGLDAGNRVVDIGGGIGLFTPGCAAAGLQATLIDDFRDPVNEEFGDGPLVVHSDLGVKVIGRDVIADGLGLELESVDVITSFDCLEHMHDSPKRLFAEVVAALRPGGWFLLGVPNCVNLRKRITVPLGHGKWSSLNDWYEQPRFRGHVREADVGDLLYIAKDMGLANTSIMGRNWQGYRSPRAWVRRVTPVVDTMLQRLPSLCADLYLLGQKL